MSTDTNIPTAQVAQTLTRSNLLYVFSQRDASKRLEAIEKNYHADVQFDEPDGSVFVGHEGVNKKAGELLEERPGWGFVPTGSVKQTNDLLYLAWGFGPVVEGGKLGEEGSVDVKATGADVILVEGGLIKKVWVIIDGLSDVKV
ncbi:uncharacterized protein A1O9_06475 [Exophiala aquamarina CBS 119918]|uniref:SnoaL-like domain-containing protein n=1 Tax=Exophiala aquamarina CBS 119918 TaxID=1182545 RepID=A0A072PEK8_9EURO|nr:uncharacterized protein A1O9_06475 [Exophiala aquamarina CBS 119918]KEF58549.1 hypothetical protein A1O9_06475 [Exophiala aquamarina CBS 119918]